MKNIEDYRMSGGREEHLARKEAIENELESINEELSTLRTAVAQLDLPQEALKQGLQITPYPIYSELKHSILVQKRLLDNPQVWCIKQYKHYPNELCAAVAAIENVLKQMNPKK